MGLNIKNDETYRLVKELAKLTGETLTGAVTQAVLIGCIASAAVVLPIAYC